MVIANNKKLLILGAGGLGRMTLETAMLLDYECYFLDDNPIGNSVCGVEVIGKLSNLERFVDAFDYCICAIGDNAIREKYNEMALKLGFHIPNIIHKTAYVSHFTKIGYGNIVLNNVCVQNGSSIGNGVVITANCEIHHDCSIGDYSLIYSCSVVRTFATIGRKVRIGSNVTVSNSAFVPDCSIILDGAVVAQNE